MKLMAEVGYTRKVTFTLQENNNGNYYTLVIDWNEKATKRQTTILVEKKELTELEELFGFWAE